MTQGDIRERAEKRVQEIKAFYIHLTVYVLVCTMLVVIDLATGSSGTTFLGLNWAYWPILGWGIAVAINAGSVFFQSSDWDERKVDEFMEREERRQTERQTTSL